jgi:phosphopentomutase
VIAIATMAMCARAAAVAASILMTMVIEFDCAYIHKREYNGYMQARLGKGRR